MDSDSDSCDDQLGSGGLGFDQTKVKQIRRQRKEERRRRQRELRKLRKELRKPENQYQATPPAFVSNSSFTTNIPGLSCSSQPVSVVSNLASPFNIARKLDFFPNNLRFRYVAELLSPQMYFIKPSIESKFVFSLNARAIQLLSEDSASKCGYNYGVLLRISQIVEHISDCFYDLVPTALQITVNSEPVPFGDRNSQYFESPIEISELLKPLNEVKLKLFALEDMKIVLGIYLVRMLTVEKAVHDFKLNFNTNWRSLRKAKEAETKMFANSNGTVRISLKCPVSKKRLEVPCVGSDCTHFQCFDLEPFVKSHHRNFQWKCPICKQWMRDVVRDKVFSKIIENVAPTCTDVGYFQGGGQVVELAHEKEPQPEVIEFPDGSDSAKKYSKKDRFASSIIEEIYIERI